MLKVLGTLVLRGLCFSFSNTTVHRYGWVNATPDQIFMPEPACLQVNAVQ